MILLVRPNQIYVSLSNFSKTSIIGKHIALLIFLTMLSVTCHPMQSIFLFLKARTFSVPSFDLLSSSDVFIWILGLNRCSLIFLFLDFMLYLVYIYLKQGLFSILYAKICELVKSSINI
jgi:hypothetical protein